MARTRRQRPGDLEEAEVLRQYTLIHHARLAGHAPDAVWITPEDMVKLAGADDYTVMIDEVPVRAIEVLEAEPKGSGAGASDIDRLWEIIFTKAMRR